MSYSRKEAVSRSFTSTKHSEEADRWIKMVDLERWIRGGGVGGVEKGGGKNQLVV